MLDVDGRESNFCVHCIRSSDIAAQFIPLTHSKCHALLVVSAFKTSAMVQQVARKFDLFLSVRRPLKKAEN